MAEKNKKNRHERNRHEDSKRAVNKNESSNYNKKQDEESEIYQFEGNNSVLELLKTTKDINKIFIQRGIDDSEFHKIFAMATKRNILVQKVNKEKLDEISVTKNHQGVIAMASVENYVEIDDILKIAAEKNEDPFIVMLDGITDTYNLGAIIRSCEGCGVHGLIITKNRSASLNATVAKTSAGAVFHLPVARVTNLTQTIEKLKKNGLWVYSGDLEGSNVFETEVSGPVLLIIGSEGDGVSRLVKDNSDFLLSIPLKGKIESLNASVAAAILMFEIRRKKC